MSPKPEPPSTGQGPVRHDVRGPEPDGIVEALADDYIRFEGLPEWQKELRTQIRDRCEQLQPEAEQILHARFYGPKHPKADIENLLLYNIGTFKTPGRHGIRFEHGLTIEHAQYGFVYRYALADRSAAFGSWIPTETLASFDWIDLGAMKGEKTLAQVWLALARGGVDLRAQATPDAPFAVRLEVRPPSGVQPLWGARLKGFFDGVISAFQASTDPDATSESASRLAADLPADADEIERLLLDQRRAVLGTVCRLVSPYGSGVKWDPCDHLCVAGELLAAGHAAGDPGNSWAIRGELVEVSRT